MKAEKFSGAVGLDLRGICMKHGFEFDAKLFGLLDEIVHETMQQTLESVGVQEITLWPAVSLAAERN